MDIVSQEVNMYALEYTSSLHDESIRLSADVLKYETVWHRYVWAYCS